MRLLVERKRLNGGLKEAENLGGSRFTRFTICKQCRPVIYGMFYYRKVVYITTNRTIQLLQDEIVILLCNLLEFNNLTILFLFRYAITSSVHVVSILFNCVLYIPKYLLENILHVGDHVWKNGTSTFFKHFVPL